MVNSDRIWMFLTSKCCLNFSNSLNNFQSTFRNRQFTFKFSDGFDFHFFNCFTLTSKSFWNYFSVDFFLSLNRNSIGGSKINHFFLIKFFLVNPKSFPQIISSERVQVPDKFIKNRLVIVTTCKSHANNRWKPDYRHFRHHKLILCQYSQQDSSKLIIIIMNYYLRKLDYFIWFALWFFARTAIK